MNVLFALNMGCEISCCKLVKAQGVKTQVVKVVNWKSHSRALKSESEALKRAFESLESSVDAEKGNSDKRVRQIHTVRMDGRVRDPRLIRKVVHKHNGAKANCQSLHGWIW